MIKKENIREAKEYLKKVTRSEELMGCSALLLENGKETLYLQAGYADKEKNVPFGRNTICRLFSVTKVFTTVAVHKAIELGLFRKEDPASLYLPNLKNAKYMENGVLISVPSPTIRDLLNMQAGFNYMGEGYNEVYKAMEESSFSLSTQEFAERITSLPLVYKPGTERRYSVAADLLGAIIERTSGISFLDFLSKYLFGPSGIKEAGFWLEDKNRDRLAAPYRKDGEVLKKMDHLMLGIRIDGKKNAFESGGAGLHATIDEVASFGKALLEGKILSKKTLQEMVQKDQDEDILPRNWMTPDGDIYKNLLSIRREKDSKDPGSNVGDFGWNGWLGCDLILSIERQSVFVFFTQRADYGQGKANKELRAILYK